MELSDVTVQINDIGTPYLVVSGGTAPYTWAVLPPDSGAGDAFASGLIYGRLKGWDWYKSARMGNATGAIVVTRQGCANFMPYEQEALNFIDKRGGF